jgi:hypothetical protein
MNLAKTASVKSVTTDTKILDAKRVETAELLVDGVSISEVVPKWKPREHVYRCVLEDDDNYIIYDDEGNFLDCKLDKLENGTGLFQGTKGVEEFSFSLPSLTNGSNMFANCNLGEKAVESILRTIPEYSEGSHPLTMNMSQDAFEKFNEITGNYLMTPGIISYKGWEIVSNAVVTLPDGYRKVEYLESTGTQYINTEVYGKNSSSVFLSYTQTAAPGWGVIFGARTVKGVNELLIVIKGATQNGISCGSGNRKISLPSADLNKRYEITITPTFGRISSVDDLVEEEFENDETYITAKPCYLFTYIFVNKIECMVHARVHGLEMRDGIKQELKFVPALDPTGAPCMYDLVSRKPFYNVGTGDFIYPSESTTYSLRKVLPDWGKLTEHGLRRLYHAPTNYTGELHDYALANGFKPIIESEMPEEGYWSPRWTETEEEIILEWDITSNAIAEEEELTNV